MHLLKRLLKQYFIVILINMNYFILFSKTIIVPNEQKSVTRLIKKKRKSKSNKGPKRLRKQSISREKNGKKTKWMNDEIEGNYQSIIEKT